MSTPFTTQVTDTLYTPSGVLVTNGSLSVVNTETFLSADGFTIMQGFNSQVPIVNGLFSVNLIPNEGTEPASSYTVQVRCTQGYFEQHWVVPHSDTPVSLQDVAGV